VRYHASDGSLVRGALGGCVLITGSGRLEIGVDAQLEAFRKVVGKGVERDAVAQAGAATER